jgi:hypothetical protein
MLNDFLPPTENLYKFISITGLFLFVLSFYPFYLQHKLAEQQFELIKNQAILRLDSRLLEKEIETIIYKLQSISNKFDELAKIHNEVIQLYKDKTESPQNNEQSEPNLALNDKLAELKNKLEETESLNKNNPSIEAFDKLIEKAKAVDIKGIELGINSKLISFYESEIDRLMYLGWFLSGLGAFLGSYGFKLWYEKIQKYNDLILEKQSLEGTNKQPHKKRIRLRA